MQIYSRHQIIRQNLSEKNSKRTQPNTKRTVPKTMQNEFKITSSVASHMFNAHNCQYAMQYPSGQRTVSDFHTNSTTANYGIRAILPPPPGFVPIQPGTASIYGSYFDIGQTYLQSSKSSFPFDSYETTHHTNHNHDNDDDMFPTFPSLSMKAVKEVQDKITFDISPFVCDNDAMETPRKNYDNTYGWLYAENDLMCEPFGEFDTHEAFTQFISENSSVMISDN